MWYVKLNGHVLPTPYQRFGECMDACRQIKKEMVAVITEPVWID